MKRLYPRQIQDKMFLSRLLDQYLHALTESPLQVTLRALSYDAQIPESVFRRLADLHRNTPDAVNINASDFHILFSNILFRYPTVKMWLQDDGNVYIEM